MKNDKKNSTTHLRLILPNETGKIFSGLYDDHMALMNALNEYFDLYSKAA